MPSPTPLVQRLLIVWGALWVVSFLTELADSSLSMFLALDPALLRGKIEALPGVIGYALVHSPMDLLHVAFNAYLLFAFGPEVETLYPKRQFLKFLLIAVLAGAGAHLLLAWASPADFGTPVVGGSGIVSAVIAVNAAIYPDRVLNLIILQVRMIRFFQFLLLLDILGFIAMAAHRGGMVAADVHLAGAAVGWTWAGGFARFDLPFAKTRAKAQQKRATREREKKVAAEAELDRILDKISREGMPSLTAKERKFLEDRSHRS